MLRSAVALATLGLALAACAPLGGPMGRSAQSDLPYRVVDGQEVYTGLSEVSEDPAYGRSPENPVKVGGRNPANERRYLNALRGPGGEAVTYERRGSCCGFETSASPMGLGLLDMYDVEYEGLAAPITLYLDFYRFEQPKAPQGFTIAP